MTTVELAEGEPLAIVGDVHGADRQLDAALQDLLALGRRVVLLGDYVNRGAGSRAVLALLAAARDRLGEQLVLLRGNHDAALLAFLETGEATAFLRHRGVTTIRSYVSDPGPDVLADFREGFPADHRAVLESTALCAEGPDVLVAHAGYQPTRPLSRTETDLTTGRWNDLIRCQHPPRALTVVGHYTQRSGQPFVSDRLLALDTGAGSIPAAPLTAVLLPERTFRAYP